MGTFTTLTEQLRELDGAVTSLRAAGDVTDAAGEELARLLAEVRESISVGDGGTTSYVVSSLASQAAAFAETARGEGDGAGAARWHRVASGAQRLAVALVPAAR